MGLKCGWHFWRVGGGGDAVSCQKEETEVNVLAKGCVECQEGRWNCFFSTLWAAGQNGAGWWVQMGTLPRPKLVQWGLPAWRAPHSVQHDRVATADCCVWPTYRWHRRGQNGPDYLSEWRWPTCGGSFRETLGGFSHPLSPVPRYTTS